jgi:hypothetical protein
VPEAFLVDLVKDGLATRTRPINAQLITVQVEPTGGIVVGHAEIHH